MKDAAVAYVKNLSETQLATLAHEAQKWVRDAQNKDSFTALTTPSKPAIADTTDSTKGVATIPNLTSGYYLVFPEMFYRQRHFQGQCHCSWHGCNACKYPQE